MSLRIVGLCLGGMAALTVAFLLMKRLVESTEEGSEERLHDLVAHLLAERVGRKLGQPQPDVLAALLGRQVPADLRSEIDRALRSVMLTFRRADDPETAELRVDVAYTDGDTYCVAVDRLWVDLPAKVRESFLRTGERIFSCRWPLPWSVA